MVKIRRWSAYRALERPYTRVSRYRNKNYTRGKPHVPIAQFEMGVKQTRFTDEIVLVSESGVQIRAQALEAARMATNRRLEKSIGKENFYMKLVSYPHHILRENPLASGAGADRMSTGMARPFGKTIGRASQVRQGTVLFKVECANAHIKQAKEALRLAGHRLPMTCSIKVLSH